MESPGSTVISLEGTVGKASQWGLGAGCYRMSRSLAGEEEGRGHGRQRADPLGGGAAEGVWGSEELAEAGMSCNAAKELARVGRGAREVEPVHSAPQPGRTVHGPVGGIKVVF